MMSAPVDPRSALDSANESELVQKKLSIDAMRKRVSGGPSEESKLREACEGFESIFLQKMWEQMRKNVKKEGYLHSKDEEAYQSMFDVELAKKMASAGGIGLADMLYEQLGQRLHNVSKTTGSGAMRAPLPIEPARPPKPVAETPAAPPAAAPGNLYSEPEADAAPDEDTAEETLAAALRELAGSRDPALDPANATYPMFDLQTGTPMNPVAGRMKEDSDPKREIVPTPLPERVSPPGRSRPSNAVGTRQARRKARTAAVNTVIQPATAQARPVGAHAQPVDARTQPANVQAQPGNMQAQPGNAGRIDFGDDASFGTPGEAGRGVETGQGVWPVQGEIMSSYGRQPDNTWNTGVSIAAVPGSPVAAPMDGVVSRIGEKDGLPQLVLAHDGGLTSHFINVASSLIEGDRVTAGMEIAQISAGGEYSPAATPETIGRMRYEVRRGELAINPGIFPGERV